MKRVKNKKKELEKLKYEVTQEIGIQPEAKSKGNRKKTKN